MRRTGSSGYATAWRVLLAGALVLGTTPAWAQNASPAPVASPAPMEQALSRTAEDEAPAATPSVAPSPAPSAAPSPTPSPAQAKPPAGPGYLGIVVAPLGDALRAQLAAVLPANTGTLITRVEQDAAAAKSGLRRHDIIAAVDGQNIADARALVDRLRSRKAGDHVTITIVREGRKQDLAVTLGEGPRDDEFPGAEATGAEWEALQNIKIQKTAPEKLSVELSFQDANGAMVSRTYTGSRAEIEKQVRQDTALTASRRDYVMRNLRGIVQGPGSEVIERGTWRWGEPQSHRRIREMHAPWWDDMFDYRPDM